MIAIQKLIGILLLLGAGTMLYAQNVYTLPQLTPQSPNSAGLGKYGEIPVSLSTGIPNIAIPLLQIKSGNVSLPVTLTYHNNGLKVQEIPSWVGMGWDLRAGGLISYQQRGLPDFEPDGGLLVSNAGDSLDAYLTGQMNTLRKFNYENDVIDGELDAEYDLYHYSFPGSSGSFYFTASGEIVTVPRSNLKIRKDSDNFYVTDERGNLYSFTVAENAQLNGDPYDPLLPRRGFNGIASYLLSSIVTIEGRTIYFHYTSFPFEYEKLTNYYKHFASKPYDPCPYRQYDLVHTYTYTDNYLLDSIQFDEGSVVFERSSGYRLDLKTLDNTLNVPYLKRVKLLNKKQEVIRQFDLAHSYFGSNRRLKLDGVYGMATDTVERWQLEYYDATDSFPAFTSFARDHWGYFNDVSNTNGIPRARYDTLLSNWGAGWANADRRAKEDKSIRGVLKKIKYPTGGETELTYEANRFTVINLHNIPQPFLEYDELDYSDLSTEMSTSTSTGPVVTGSFTLASRERIRVLASRTDDDPGAVVSSISLSTTVNGADILAGLLPYNCVGTTCNADGVISLAAGTYYYKLIRNTLSPDPDPPSGYATLTLSKLVFDDLIPYKVGGLRVATVETKDGTGSSLVKKYIYNDSFQNTLVNSPDYITRTKINVNESTGSGVNFCQSCSDEIKIHDESAKPMPGNPITYRFVEELSGITGENGKTEYTFSLPVNLQSHLGIPYVPPFMASWRDGSVLHKKVFKKESGGYSVLEEEANEYESTCPGSVTKGIKAGYFRYCEMDLIDYREISVNEVNFQTENYYLKNSLRTQYTPAGNMALVSASSYTSTAHTLPSSVSSVNSQDETVTERTIFSFDYDTTFATDATAQAIRNLRRKNILVPIEKVFIKTIAGTEYLTGSVLYTYHSASPTLAKVYQVQLGAPALLSGFTGSSINGSGVFVKDSRYEEKASLNSYDAYNNLLEANYKNNLTQSYVWDHLGNYVIAECTNAAVSSIAYSSFEADSKGSWVFSGTPGLHPTAPTGKQAYNLSAGSITRSGLSSGTSYVVSYWKRDSTSTVTLNSASGSTLTTKNGWQLIVHEVTGTTSITVAGSATIDELRLHPKGSRMLTYAYLPLVGIMTQADINNRLVHYEYDSYERLNLIRDDDRHIIKRICYNYFGQSNNCVIIFKNVTKSGNYSRNNCGSGSTGSAETYTVPAGTYTSPISQAYVDSVAQADVTANGQTYANAHGTCTSGCNPSCGAEAEGFKCVEGSCEQGVKVYTNLWYNQQSGKCELTFHYEFSDSSWSANYTEYSYGECPEIEEL